jgi:hypothetical protein
VTLFRVPTTHLQTVANRLQADAVAFRTFLNTAMFQAEDIETDLDMTVVRLSGALSERLERLHEAGEFWLDGLDPGLYRLEIELEDRAVEMPVLEI